MAEIEIDKGMALKVSLPSSLVDGLQAVCDAGGISKSDAARFAIEAYLNSSPLWTNRRFFFPDVSQKWTDNPQEALKNFRAGTYVKLAGGVSHFPASALFFVGIVHRVLGQKLYVELPMYLSRPTALIYDQMSIQSQMSIAAEAKMVIPRFENIPNLSAWGGTTSTLMYEIDAGFIWGVEADPGIQPAMVF